MAKSKCSKDGLRKLSWIQKVILKYLIEKEDGRCRIEELSWHVARIFNVEHGDRIWSARKQKEKMLEDFREEKNEQVALRKGEVAMQTFRMIDIFHRKKELLTGKHCASFSRSLSRLHDRGLVDLYGQSTDYGWRTTRVGLTKRGHEVAERVAQEIEEAIEALEFRNG